MRPGSLFYSSLILLFSSFLVGLGLFLMIISQTLQWQEKIIIFLQDGAWHFIWLGFAIALTGLFSFAIFFKVFKRQFYILSMDSTSPISVDTEVVRKDLMVYLNNLFPQGSAFCEVVVQQKTKRLKFEQLEFFADLPYVTFEDREGILTSIENHLKAHLSQLYGYQNEFLFNVSFKEHH